MRGRPNREQLEDRARLVARAFVSMGVDAVNVGQRDLAAGLAFVAELGRKPGVPWVSTNLRSAGGDYPFPRWRIVERGGARIGVVGLLPEFAARGRSLGLDVQPPAEALREALAALDNVDAVVCLSNLGLPLEKQLAREAPELTIVVGGGTKQHVPYPPAVGDTLILHGADRGRFLGVLDLPEGVLTHWERPKNLQKKPALERQLAALRQRIEALKRIEAGRNAADDDSRRQPQNQAFLAQARSVESALAELDSATTVFSHRIVALDPSAGEDREIARWVSEHKARKARSRTAARAAPAPVAPPQPIPTPKGPQHRGSASCRKCHDEAHQAWLSTPHARAYASLREKKPTPECLACHATRLRRPGGSALEPVVGCETCHGPGGDHPANGKMIRRPDERVCRQCHRGFHPDSTFDFAPSYDRIRCERDGGREAESVRGEE